jgi:chaperonin GroEL
MDLVAKTV